MQYTENYNLLKPEQSEQADIPAHQNANMDIIDTQLAQIHTEIENKISAVYKYRGSVETYDDLPAADQTIGDVYNVNNTGKNYAWTGEVWDDLGGVEALATSANNGLMSKEDFLKLANIEIGANKTTINNTLTSTSTTEALSAAQGKALKDDLDAHKAESENVINISANLHAVPNCTLSNIQVIKRYHRIYYNFIATITANIAATGVIVVISGYNPIIRQFTSARYNTVSDEAISAHAAKQYQVIGGQAVAGSFDGVSGALISVGLTLYVGDVVFCYGAYDI